MFFLLPFPGEFCLHSKPTLFAAIKRSTFLKRYLKFLVKTVPTECAVVLYLLVVACQFSTWVFKAILCSHFVDIEMKKCLQLVFFCISPFGFAMNKWLNIDRFNLSFVIGFAAAVAVSITWGDGHRTLRNSSACVFGYRWWGHIHIPIQCSSVSISQFDVRLNLHLATSVISWNESVSVIHHETGRTQKS